MFDLTAYRNTDGEFRPVGAPASKSVREVVRGSRYGVIYTLNQQWIPIAHSTKTNSSNAGRKS